ncbi:MULTISPECIES: hypothetical protein [unclassified Gilliamella]|nr:hypothetical protein [Gilliamella apicola]
MNKYFQIITDKITELQVIDTNLSLFGKAALRAYHYCDKKRRVTE